MLGVGLFGAGRVSGAHARAVEELPGLKLVAVTEPDASRRAAFCDPHSCAGYPDHHELLARDDVQLILAGLPHALHAPIVVDALNAGKHVLVEKPMAITLEECDQMIAAAEANDMKLMVGHTQHFFPANVAVKKRIEQGAIGEIVLATATWYKPFGAAHRPAWFLDRAQGGGMWLMNGAHMIDCLCWFFDSPIVAVKGSVTNRVLNQKADDSAIAIFEFENGRYATLVHSGSKRPVDPPDEQWFTCEVVGTEGTIQVVPYEHQLRVNTDGEYVPVEVEHRDAMCDEIEAFASAVKGDTETPVSNAYARAIVEALLAVEESSRTGREVRLREGWTA